MATGVVLAGSLGRSSNSSTSGECRRPAVTMTMSSWDGGGGGSGVTEGLSFICCCCFGGEGACSFFGDLIRSSLLICRLLPIVIGDAGGGFEIVWSGRSTPLLVLPAGVCGVSGGVGGTVVVCAAVTPSELGGAGAFLLLGDEGVCGGGGAGPFSFFRMAPFFSTSAAAVAPLTSAGSTGGNTGAGTVDVVGVVVAVAGDDFLASLCTLLLLSLVAAADGGVVAELGVVVVVAAGGDCAAAAAGPVAAGFALLSSSTGTGVDSFESLDDFDKDVGVSGSL